VLPPSFFSADRERPTFGSSYGNVT
jgi:hypothetical protein